VAYKRAVFPAIKKSCYRHVKIKRRDVRSLKTRGGGGERKKEADRAAVCFRFLRWEKKGGGGRRSCCWVMISQRGADPGRDFGGCSDDFLRQTAPGGKKRISLKKRNRGRGSVLFLKKESCPFLREEKSSSRKGGRKEGQKLSSIPKKKREKESSGARTAPPRKKGNCRARHCPGEEKERDEPPSRPCRDRLHLIGAGGGKKGPVRSLLCERKGGNFLLGGDEEGKDGVALYSLEKAGASLGVAQRKGGFVL